MAKIRAKVAKLSSDAFEEHMDSSDGFCTACGEWTGGGCEPDARKYECEMCGEHAVYGAEEMMVMGMVVLTDDDDDE